MAKLQSLTSDSTLNGTDIIYKVNDPSGTPLDRVITGTDLVTEVTNLGVGAVTGIILGTGTGVTTATAGADYAAPGDITIGNALTNSIITPMTDGTYNFYNDGTTPGQVTSIIIASGIITNITTL